MDDDEIDEVTQGYIDRYALGVELPKRNLKQALFLISSIRTLRRLQFANRKQASAAHFKVSRWLGESQVFYAIEHPGYNDLLKFASDSLDSVALQIDEKFPVT